MGPSPLAWLLRLAAFCHLCAPLAGQHFSMSRCSNDCEKMTSQIPLRLLHSYKPTEESCKIRAIVLETRQHRHFCADPKEKWVQQAMEYLDHRDTALTQNGGKFEKRVGQVTPRTTLSTKGLSLPALAEPEATVEGLASEITASSQEARRPMGTSPELPVAVTESLRTGSPPTSRAQDAGPTAGPGGTEIFKAAAVSTTVWQSSATYQSGSGLWAELPTTTAPSTQAPTTLHQTPEENMGSAGQPQWVQGQNPSPENFLEPADMNGTHTDALQNWGPDNTAQPSVAPVSSEGTPSRELGSSGSWPPKIEEPIQATADPQKLSVLITPVPDSQAATRRQAVGLLAFLGLLFCLGVGMFAYQSLQGCPRKMAGEMVEGLRYVPRSCGSNSYVLVPV